VLPTFLYARDCRKVSPKSVIPCMGEAILSLRSG
jgi:hypothetical protein